MKVHLTFVDRDLDLAVEPPANADVLSQDLGLDLLMGVMSAKDPYLREVVRRTIFSSLASPDDIRYRQAVLADCIANAEITRELFAIAVEAIELVSVAHFLGGGKAQANVLDSQNGRSRLHSHGRQGFLQHVVRCDLAHLHKGRRRAAH